MNIRIRLCTDLRQAVIERLQRAYQSGQVRLVRRIHALLFIIEGKSVDEMATTLDLGAQTVRDYVKTFLWRGVASLSYRKPAGRPPKLTKTQKKELIALIKSRSGSGGIHDGMLECSADPGLALAHLWRGISSALHLYAVGPIGLFVSEGTFCLGSSE